MNALRMDVMLAVVLCSGCCVATGQTGSSPCSTAFPVVAATAGNMFNDRQEQDLGDALAEFSEVELQIAPPSPGDTLTRIGERLLGVLPPTGVHYQFRVYESGEINGFSLAGGRVYISRKLISATKTEDDLAGVLAHEIGHLATHQTAIEISRILRIRLGVTSVGDRADIFAKVHQMLSTPPKPHEEESSERRDQLEADQVAVYAMVGAGYAPESFATFLDQISLNKGKTGNRLTDLFGMTSEESRRYRGALKLIATLPDKCRGRQPIAGESFRAWQQSMTIERVQRAVATVIGDRPLKLDPPLRPSLWHIRFSPNGRFILAQDESGISVANRETAKALYRIEAPDMDAAEFTPDSSSIVFENSGLRVEKWGMADGKRISVHEIVVLEGCTQRLLSRDGKNLLCITVKQDADRFRVRVRLIDVDSGNVFLDVPKFYEPIGVGVYSLARNILQGYSAVNTATSPDGRYLLLCVGSKTLAYDWIARQPVTLGGKLKSLQQVRMAFVAPGQIAILGEVDTKEHLYKLEILGFPDGHYVREALIGDQQFEAATRDQALIVSPLKSYNLGVLNVVNQKFEAATKEMSMDAWDRYVALESLGGGLDVVAIDTSKIQFIRLPIGDIPGLRAGTGSPDGKYLAVSLKNRAAVWDTETGKQNSLLRPFQSAWMDGNDALYGMFGKFLNLDAQQLKLTLSPFASSVLAKLEDKSWQYRDLEMRLKPMGKEKSTDRHATLEVRKMGSDTPAWTRDFKSETPICWPAEDNRMVLAWDLHSETARNEIKADATLTAEDSALKDRKQGLLLETVSPDTGKVIERVVIPEGDLSHGWNDERRAIVSGEFVLVRGERDNMVIYRLKDGSKVNELFGSPVASDARLGLVVVVNRDDEIVLVDEHTGKELQRLVMGSPVRLARILGQQTRTLMVLTADQILHRIPLENLTASSRSN